MPSKSEVQRLALSIDEVARAFGVGRSTLYNLMDGGALPFIKIGRRRVIRAEDAKAYIDGLARKAS